MKITRVTNPEISTYLLPWFVEAENELTKEDCSAALRIIMTDMSESVCVLVSSNSTHMVGFIIGYMEEKDLFIWQAQKSKDMKNMQMMVHKLYTWARSRGATKATLGNPDKRVRRLYKRKYGYRSIGGALMEKAL